MAGSALPPSKFGAGFSVGGAAAAPPRPARGISPTASPGSVGPRLNRLAIATFVTALFLGWLVAPFTLPLSIVAKRQIAVSGEGGGALARAATIISGVYLALLVVLLGLYLYT